MVHNVDSNNDPKFRAGDKVFLAEGTYPGTAGVFLRFREDVNWAELRERNGEVRAHPVAWMRHDSPEAAIASKALGKA